MAKMVNVDFACNDPDNGNFAGKVWMAEVDGNEIERDGEVTFIETPQGFRIHRRKYNIESKTEWLGNWCWNRYVMPVKEANRLVSHLRDNGWTCNTGEQRFYEWMNRQSSDAMLAQREQET